MQILKKKLLPFFSAFLVGLALTGGTVPKWQGKCPHCGEWNTLQEG
ncbi:MAG: hypothetical protein ACFNO4_07710, partial [Dialister invisus]